MLGAFSIPRPFAGQIPFANFAGVDVHRFLTQGEQKNHSEPAWLQALVAASRHGAIQLGIALASIVWTAARLVKIRYDGSGKAAPYRPRGILVYDLLGHLFRGVAFALFLVASNRDRRQLPNAVTTGYIFFLGLFRIVTLGCSRPVLLTQINAIGVCTLFLAVGADFLPLIAVGAAHRPEAVAAAAIGALFLAVLLSGLSLREWLPPRAGVDVPEGIATQPSPEETCSLIDRFCTYGRVDTLVFKGIKNDLSMSDMSSVPWHYDPEVLRLRFSKLRKQKQSTGWALFGLLWPELTYATFVGTAYPLADLSGPLALFNLLAYLADPAAAVLQPYVWLILMFGGRIVQTIFQQEYAMSTRKLAIYMKLMLTGEIYQTALASRELEGNFLNAGKAKESERSERSEQDPQGSATGMLENLISTDINSLMDLRIFLMAVTDIPSVVIAIVGLYGVIGWPCFVALGILVLSAPGAGLIMTFIQRFEEKLKVFQDRRLSLASEYLRSIKVIKYFGWEDSVKQQIRDVRVSEQKQIWNINICYIVFGEGASIMPIMSLVAMFSLHVGVNKLPLTAATAYTAITLLDTIRNNFMFVAHVSMALPKALVALRRFNSFFAAASPLDKYPEGPACIEGATFRRSAHADFRLYDISIQFVENGLNAVTGISGSGKTTLLLALLGETIKESGSVTRQRNAAFASQSSWLQAKSARENILFNTAYDELRYNTVVKACCLDVDFAELPKGDETEVGENGTALSGGQRARIALARAFYSFSTLLLLDDIFSALDTKTTVQVWNRIFCSDLVKGRTVIFITQYSWIVNEADLAITMENGRIKSLDQNIGHVRKPQPSPSDNADEGQPVHARGDSQVPSVPLTDSEIGSDKPTLVDKEVVASGAGAFPVFQYLKYFGGTIIACLTVGTLFVSTGSQVITHYWMSIWVDHAEERDRTLYYLLIYVALSLGTLLCESFAYWSFIRGGWHAARRLHEEMIASLFGVSLGWYSENPVGRIINRLSGDVESLDQQILFPTINTLAIFISCALLLSAVTTVLPIFIWPTLVLSALGVLVAGLYNRTAVRLKQIVSASQSPILSEFSEGLNGMAVLRATAATTAVFGAKLGSLLGTAAKANITQIETDQWLKFRTNTLGAFINLCAAALAILQRDRLSAGLVGFCLSQATEISSSVMGLVFSANEMNLQMQTFHRVREYCKLPPEEEIGTDKDISVGVYSDDADRSVPENWPRSGSVEFRNVTIRYDADGPDILKNVNLKFNAGERVAVVGRTGSGKSTLVLSILRFTNIVCGQILYDGVDITTIPRKALRQAVSMIPQESQLFQGTLSTNLDPTGTVDEADLQRALDVCQNIAAVRATSAPASSAASASASSTLDGDDGGGDTNANFTERLTLSTQVKSKGENFSHGQRQVLSLCRILARRSKLMLLDEATSSMDAKTDAGIQKALREAAAEGGEGRCLITIAHRLQTIADYDKVVVMGSGEVLEVGSPEELMEKQGAYYDMVMHDHEGKSSEDEAI